MGYTRFSIKINSLAIHVTKVLIFKSHKRRIENTEDKLKSV